jgi:uncharacterized tellurite resistance protein B-like protein
MIGRRTAARRIACLARLRAALDEGARWRIVAGLQTIVAVDDRAHPAEEALVRQVEAALA